MDLSITLTPEESELLFQRKKEAGEDDLTAQEYAQQMMVETLRGYHPLPKKRVLDTLDDAVMSIGGDLELLHALLRMHEGYADGLRRLKLPDDTVSEFVSLVVRLLSDVKDSVDELEKLRDLLTYTTSEQLRDDIEAARQFTWDHLDD